MIQRWKRLNFRVHREKRDAKMKGIPLVITYHYLLKDFATVIRKYLYILYLNKQVKKNFTPGPVVSFRGARKLGSYFARTKLYPLQRSVGTLNLMVNGVKFV